MSTSDDCFIERVVRPRGALPKYWCVSHGSSATARYGGKLRRCEGAYRSISHHRRFQLDPAEFAGGVALWGAVEPVYNTAAFPAERGIHVHARLKAPGKKKIDETFDAVEVSVRKDLLLEETVLITAETAVAYYVSRFLRRKIEPLFCPHCHTPHLDSDWFSVKPHRKHLCHGCNRIFERLDRSVSNPLSAVQLKFNFKDVGLGPIRARRSINIAQRDYPAGIQIWASNPALLWTSPKPEEEGIHIHGWTGGRGRPELDGTFNGVTIDGITLNEAQLRYYMAQSALSYLTGKVISLHCPGCGTAQFDRGENAFRPSSKMRVCETCQAAIPIASGRKLVVSNPFVDTIAALRHAKRNGG